MKGHLCCQIHLYMWLDLFSIKSKKSSYKKLYIIYCYFLIIIKLMCHTATNELQTKFLVVFTIGNEICGEGKEEPCQMCFCPTPPL
jgi:hypothetical protein